MTGYRLACFFSLIWLASCSVMSDIDDYTFDLDVGESTDTTVEFPPNSSWEKPTDTAQSKKTDYGTDTIDRKDPDTENQTEKATETFDPTEVTDPTDTVGDTGVATDTADGPPTEVDPGTDTGTGGDTDSEIDPLVCGRRVCDGPVANECTQNYGEIKVYDVTGTCSLAQCHYMHRFEQCEFGDCVDGVCIDNPCQGITCNHPPSPYCDGEGNLVIFNQLGHCAQRDSGYECIYNSTVHWCDGGCQDGACVEDPCEQVTCNETPAPQCRANRLVVYDRPGQCQWGECIYSEREIDCPGIAGGCRDGRCANDPCAGIECETPPANYCIDEYTLIAYHTNGHCDPMDGCRYAGDRIDCPGSCVDGECEGDPCAGVRCDIGPEPYCEDNTTLVQWDGMWDVCQNGVCLWGLEYFNCGDSGCDDGFCLDDPCYQVVCDTPPPNECYDNTMYMYDQVGWCENGNCYYDTFSEPCPMGCDGDHCYREVVNPQDWRLLRSGSFEMGSLADESEQPVHTVWLPDFEVLQHEVTVWQYRECVKDTYCVEPDPTACNGQSNWNLGGRDNHPMNCVTWDEAAIFCDWIWGRLASESEWEYAATSGGQPDDYPWGGSDEADCNWAIMADHSGEGCGTGETAPICNRTNGNTMQDVCDMAGNVEEWVFDDWHDTYKTEEGILAPEDGTPWIDGEGTDIAVVRGGSYRSNSTEVRTRYRSFRSLSDRELGMGIRCVRDVVPLEGEIKRSISLPEGSDGQGTMCVVLLNVCPSVNMADDEEIFQYAQMTLHNVDINNQDMPVPFTLFAPWFVFDDGMSYSLAAFFLDDGGNCTDDGPRYNDLVSMFFNDTDIGCAPVDAASSANFYNITLNTVI